MEGANEVLSVHEETDEALRVQVRQLSVQVNAFRDLSVQWRCRVCWRKQIEG